MTFVYAGRYSNAFIGQNTATKTLTFATSLAVRLPGTTTNATLYTSRTKSTVLANPLPVGVAVNSPGIDTSGNVTFFADPGTYDLLINGTITETQDIDMDLAEKVQGPLNAGSFLATAVANPTISTGQVLVYDPTSNDVRLQDPASSAALVGTVNNPFSGVVWRADDQSLQQATVTSVNGVYQIVFSPATIGNPIPGMPVLTAATAGAAKVTLSWALTSNASSYQPYYSTGTDPTVATAFGSPVMSTSVAVTGLTNSTAYNFWLKAIGTGGTSGFSSSLAATPLASGTPTVPVPAAPVLTAASGVPNAVPLTLAAVTGAVSYTTTRISGSGGGTSGITVRDSGTDGNGYSTTTTITIPTDAQVGDYCYWGCGVYNGQTFATPTGWTSIAHNDDGTYSSAYVFRKKIASGDIGTSFTATTNTVGQICSSFAVLPGIDGTTPEDTALPSWGTGYGSTTTGSVTTASNTDGALVFFFEGRGGSVTATWGSGLTNIAQAGGGIYVSSCCALGTGGASGSTLGPFTVTSAPNANGQAILIPLRAAAPTTGGVTGTVVHTGPELSFSDSGLTNGTAYNYQSVATNSSAVSSSPSAIATATPAAVVVVTPPSGSTPFASIQEGVYRNNGFTNAVKGVGQTPGGVADYAVAARKSTTLSQMYALDFLDNRGSAKASQYASQSGNGGTLEKWAATGRRMVFGTCGICVEGDTYAQCASGAYDGYWNSFGDALNRNGLQNSILRPACEMDNAWNWQNTQSKAHPADFVASFKRFVTIIRAKVPTITICWNPTSDAAAAYLGTSGLDLYYPGDAYVDWIGLDVYDSYTSGGATPTSPWTTAQKQALWSSNTGPKMANISSYAQKHGKPLAFPEWGLRLWDNSSGGDDEVFVNNMVSFMTNTANNVIFQAFWEDPSNGGEGVFDPDSGRAWKTPLARAALNAALGSAF